MLTQAALVAPESLSTQGHVVVWFMSRGHFAWGVPSFVQYSINQGSTEAQKHLPSGWHQWGWLFLSLNFIHAPGCVSRNHSSVFICHHHIPFPSLELKACHCRVSSVLGIVLQASGLPQAIFVWYLAGSSQRSSPSAGGIHFSSEGWGSKNHRFPENQYRTISPFFPGQVPCFHCESPCSTEIDCEKPFLVRNSSPVILLVIQDPLCERCHPFFSYVKTSP